MILSCFCVQGFSASYNNEVCFVYNKYELSIMKKKKVSFLCSLLNKEADYRSRRTFKHFHK